MATDAVRAAARRLGQLFERFRHCFARPEGRRHAETYVRGLFLATTRKSVEPIALEFAKTPAGEPAGGNEVLAMQKFLTESPWDAGDVQKEIQAVFAEEFVPSAAGDPRSGPGKRELALGVVGIIDESSFVKKGTESVGVKRQWCGRLGKTENCQVGVFLAGATPAGTLLLDYQLYLPEEWAKDDERRKRCRVPTDIDFATKPQIASETLRRTRETGLVRFDWIVVDEAYGRDGEFLDDLEENGERYVAEVPVNTTVWTADPATQIPVRTEGKGRPLSRPSRESVRSVRDAIEALPEGAWRTLNLREGAKGPVACRFARLRVWAVRHRGEGPAIWLVARRSLDNPSETKYYVSNADESVSLEMLALAAAVRWRVEELFEQAKGELGMADYESRSWTSWHHHMALVALAHLYVVQTKRDLNKDVPDLTLPMAIRLLVAAFARPTLTPEDAERLTDYHLNRNRIAAASHRKTFLRRHKGFKEKPLL